MARTFISKKERAYRSVVYGEREGKSIQGKGYIYVYHPLQTPRFSKASLETLTASCVWGNLSSYIAAAQDQSPAVIRRYMRGDRNPVMALRNFQHAIRDKETSKRNAAKKQAVAEAMNHIRELPEDWENFVDNYPLLYSRYIIYQRGKGKKISGFCTHCGADVSLQKAKHNARAECPACGSPVFLKSKGITKWLRDWCHAAYIQPASGGAFYVRSFSYSRDYQKDLRNYQQSSSEDRRYYVKSDGSVDMYDRYDGKWRKRHTFDEEKAMVYPFNVRQVLSETPFKYSGLEVLAASKTPAYIVGYLEKYKSFSGLEYLPKMGLYRLASDLSGGLSCYDILDAKASTPKEMFPFGKDEIRLFARLDMTANEIQLYKTYQMAGYRLTDEWIELFRRVNINPRELLCFDKKISPFRAYRYLVKQKTPDYTFSALQTIWSDYLSMAAAEHYDLNDEYYLFPPKLVKMHDELDTIGRMRKIDKKYIAKMERRAKECAPLNFIGDKFIIRVPTSLDDLVYNGMKQKICVANPNNGYIQSYCSKKKYLLFLRRLERPDDPYVTFEMTADGRIGQVSGYDNHDVSGAVRSAINRWHKKVALPFVEQKTKKVHIAVAV